MRRNPIVQTNVIPFVAEMGTLMLYHCRPSCVSSNLVTISNARPMQVLERRQDPSCSPLDGVHHNTSYKVTGKATARFYSDRSSNCSCKKKNGTKLMTQARNATINPTREESNHTLQDSNTDDH